MSGTGVPVVAVNEHRDVAPGEDEVGGAARDEATLQAEACACSVQGSAEQQLGFGVDLAASAEMLPCGGADPARHPAAAFWGVVLNRSWVSAES